MIPKVLFRAQSRNIFSIDWKKFRDRAQKGIFEIMLKVIFKILF